MEDIFESGDVVELVGINAFYLNKFVERGLYGITPSERMGVGRGGRRWFSRDDVFGIALVWWLFESGLRSDVIKRVLTECFGQKEANAKKAALRLREEGVEFLVIRRMPRPGGGKRRRYPRQIVSTLDKSELLDLIEKGNGAAIHVIPIGEMFGNLELAIGEAE